MKNISFLILFACLFMACADDKNASRPGEPVQEDQDTVPRDFTRDEVDVDRDNTEVEDETVPVLKEPADQEFAGKYRKTESDARGSGECDVLQVSFTSPSRVCVVPGEIYISAKFVKTDINEANVFLLEAVETGNSTHDLAWEKIDRDTPIATLDLKPDGSLEVDWKGFAIDGEVATDYALQDKETLEGTYQRE